MAHITFDVGAFALGCGGALAHECLRWVGLRTQDKLPAYLSKLHYWLLTACLVLIGGGVSAFLGASDAAQALAFGIAAPAILSRLGAASSPEPELAASRHIGTTDASLRDFLRG